MNITNIEDIDNIIYNYVYAMEFDNIIQDKSYFLKNCIETKFEVDSYIDLQKFHNLFITNKTVVDITPDYVEVYKQYCFKSSEIYVYEHHYYIRNESLQITQNLLEKLWECHILINKTINKIA